MQRSAWVPLATFGLAVVLSLGLNSAPLRSMVRLQAAETCPDPIRLPVCIRPVKAKSNKNKPPVPGGSTTDFPPAALAGIETGMSDIWKRCCISFTVTLGKEVELPADSFRDGKLAVANSDGQTITPNEGLRKLFKTKNSKKCLNLYYAADVVAGGLPAGSDLKGAALVGENGMIVDDGVTPAVNAHEAGHNLGLQDNDTPGNLMSGGGMDPNPPTGIEANQCDTARARAKRYLQSFK